MTKIAVLQPSYIPWLGYFDQIDVVDNFIFYDDVQYTKNDWRNRNKIKTFNSWIWLTIPVKYKFGMKINEVKIDNSKNWKKVHLNSLKTYYKKSHFFKEIYKLMEKNIENATCNLVEINVKIIEDISNYLGINTKFYFSSQLNIKGKRNQKLINICKYFDCNKYFTGYSAEKYLDVSLFKKNNVNVYLQNYNHPKYLQLYEGFIPNLSILDLLFNYGKTSINIIRSGRRYIAYE